MSIRQAQRKPTDEKLEVLVISQKLLEYTLIILNNKKIFPTEYVIPTDPTKRSKAIREKQHRETVKQILKIIEDNAISINSKLHTANGIYVKTANHLKARLRLECEALEMAYSIKSVLQVVASAYHIELRRIKYWSEINDLLIVKIKAWVKSEREWCRKLYEDGKVNKNLSLDYLATFDEDIL